MIIILYHHHTSFLHVRSASENLTVKLDGEPLDMVSHYKYLGYYIDDQLNCRKMLEDSLAKLNYILKTFGRTRPSLTLKASIAVFKSKFLSYIDYISLFKYMLSNNDFRKLQTIQNRALRCVFCLPKCSNVDNLHCRIRTLHVENRRYLLLMVYMFKLTLAPDFCPASNESLSTRSSGKLNFHLIRPWSNKFHKSHCYIGKKLWNELSSEDQNMSDVDSFKRRIKLRLFASEKALYDPLT